MKNFKEDHFIADTSLIQWCSILPQTDEVEIVAKELATLFNFIIEKHAPMRETRASDKYCPQINISLQALMKQQDKLKKQAINSLNVKSKK